MDKVMIGLNFIMAVLLIGDIVSKTAETIQKCSTNKYDYLKYKEFVEYVKCFDDELDNNYEFGEIAEKIRGNLGKEFIHE